MRQRLFGFVALALVLGAAAPASADFNIATGLKWVPLRYTHPVAVAAGGMGAIGEDSLYGWVRSNKGVG